MTISRKKDPSNFPRKATVQKPKKIAHVLEKQMLVDLEKRISLNVGQFLVLTEEGDLTQIALAHQRAKSEFLKFAPEMSRLALHLGGEIGQVVADYLESVDVVLHSSEMLDDDKVARCFHTTQRLQSELKL